MPQSRRRKPRPVFNHRCQPRNFQCSRCGSFSLRTIERWNAIYKAGVLVGVLCPDCQTVEENLEAEINFATTDYHQDALGRVRGFPKMSG
jgi:transcription elongation factor Elf1